VRPVFRMTLRNVGDGQVVRGREFDQRSSCLRSSEQDLESNTAVVYAILGNKALECLPSLPRLEGVAGAKPALVKFYDGEAEVMCRIPEGEDIMTSYNYESMLQVFVDYVYQVRESVTVQIDDSSKAYVPPDISELRCSDFDADYASCRQFSEKHGDYFSNMNCFYCDELKKCLSGGCAQCPGSTDEYVSTRMCVHDCPRGDPVVSVSKTADGRRLKFSCDDPLGTKANEHGRCGCGEFLYYLVYSPEECTEETFQVAKAMTEKGTFNPADEKTRAEVMIPGEWFVELPDGDLQEAYVCVAGRTAADESGDWKLSKPKHEPLHS
ncbi:hypothetical protein JXA12_02075, partial [Candidatus Woesearchaeota archaeon]|nr:hypothetical protein [Candidatus Woesearchaeota archaeon]